MQTSLRRRQRHRRNGAARRSGGSGATRPLAVAIPIFLFASFLVLGAVGFLATVSAYAYYSRDLPDPRDLLANIQFNQQTTVLDRTGTVTLAQFGDQKRELVTFADIPPELIDATTAIEDKDFWSNPGFDVGGFISATLDTLAGRPRGGSTITQQLVRARLLPDTAFAGSVYERKIREIIQSIRLTQEFPGEAGKEEIITAYLNQNFYGNQSYGVRAAALSYFGKDLKDLTLAEMAILAAIPQSPTKFDLTKNAVRECAVDVGAGEECPTDQVRLVVPADTEIVARRNRILTLMETRAVLSSHTVAEYEAATREPVVLASQAVAPWKAAQFVWQVHDQLGSILCGPDSASQCEKVDTGGYRVTTTLDWSMQQTVEKWLYAAARAPNLKDTATILQNLGIPKADQTWITALAKNKRDINNGAAAVEDYRTGQIYAYAGSAGYSATGNDQFKPQYDVLSLAYRQPGSSIKPINYLIGIDDKTMTAASMFMDVVTDFGKNYTPTQADGLERGPVSLRSALEFSLNIPAIKAGLENGLDHFFARAQDFGIRWGPGTLPVPSMSIGTLEVHPIDLLGAYGAIADGGILMPRTMILEVQDASGKVIYSATSQAAQGTRVASPQAAYIITDILQGNTIKSVNPFWSEWAIYDGKTRRPAAYKTGTTQDNKDVLAFGYVAPPETIDAPALAVGVWMGNSDSTPNNGSLSLDSSAPLWSAIMTEITKGTPITDFARPKGIVDATVDAFSGLLPGPYTTVTRKEIFIDGTVPRRTDDLHTVLDVDQATGLLWQDGCAGPKVSQGFLDFSASEPAFPQWQEYTQGWVERARTGPGVKGGPKNTRTSYFYGSRFYPFGQTWGGAFPPTETCQPVAPSCPPIDASPTPAASQPGNGNKPTPTVPGGASPGPTFEPCPTPLPSPTPGPSAPLPSPTALPPPSTSPSTPPKPVPSTAP
jgi:membrane peptidoglycan carboxypeptidase